MRITQPILHCIVSSGFHEEFSVDSRSFEILQEIRKELSVFEPVEDDECRVIWIQVPKGTAEEWKTFVDECNECSFYDLEYYQEALDSDYSHDIEWFALSVSKYRDYTFLKITDTYSEYAIITNRNMNGYTELNDLTWFLEPLLEQVRELVQSVSENPEAYNSFIEKNVPYHQRSGKIYSKELNRIVPEYRMNVADREHSIAVMRELIRRHDVYHGTTKEGTVSSDYYIKQQVPEPFEEMTIRRFCHYYRIADKAWLTGNTDATGKNCKDDIDDLEYYSRNGFRRNLGDYDVDSADDFIRFANDHYGELGLSRMNVGATQHLVKDRWILCFGISYSASVEAGLKIAMALFDSGAPFVFYDARTLLHILEETGRVRLESRTFHDHLTGDDDEGAYSLPFYEDCGKNDEISRSQFDDIVKHTVWEPMDKLVPDKSIPLSDKIYDIIRDEVSAPLTVSEIRQKVESRYSTYLSVVKEHDGKGYYYLLPDINGRIKFYERKPLFGTFNEAMKALILKFTNEAKTTKSK